jgi:hypothetical protein
MILSPYEFAGHEIIFFVVNRLARCVILYFRIKIEKKKKYVKDKEKARKVKRERLAHTYNLSTEMFSHQYGSKHQCVRPHCSLG